MSACSMLGFVVLSSLISVTGDRIPGVTEIYVKQSITSLKSVPVISYKSLHVDAAGHYAVEVRTQLHAGEPAQKNLFEGNLTQTQIDVVSRILQDPTIQAMGRFQVPQIPATSDTVEVFTIQAKRSNGQDQELGYSNWSETVAAGKEAPEARRKGASPSVSTELDSNEKKLKPVLSWFNSIIRAAQE
jgi:hypothetical protein